MTETIKGNHEDKCIGSTDQKRRPADGVLTCLQGDRHAVPPLPVGAHRRGGYGTPSARDVGLHAFFLVRDGRLHRSGIPAGRRAARAIAGRTCRRDAQQRLPTVAGHRAGSRRTDGRGDKRRFDHAARRRAYPRAAVHTGTFPALYGSHLLSEGCVYGLPQGARRLPPIHCSSRSSRPARQCCASDCLCRTKPISAGFA